MLICCFVFLKFTPGDMSSDVTCVTSHRDEPIRAIVTNLVHCFDILQPPPTRHLIALVWSNLPREDRSTVKTYLQTRSLEERGMIQLELSETPQKGIDRIERQIRWMHQRSTSSSYANGCGVLHDKYCLPPRTHACREKEICPPSMASLEKKIAHVLRPVHPKVDPHIA